jgi:hypothetical protein
MQQLGSKAVGMQFFVEGMHSFNHHGELLAMAMAQSLNTTYVVYADKCK